MNLVPNDRSKTTWKLSVELLSLLMGQLAVTLGVTLTKERIALYLEPLSDLNEKQITRAFQTAAREYKPFNGSFPAPAELREYALNVNSNTGIDPKSLPQLGEKPADWKPVKLEDLYVEIERRRKDSMK